MFDDTYNSNAFRDFIRYMFDMLVTNKSVINLSAECHWSVAAGFVGIQQARLLVDGDDDSNGKRC